MITSINGAGLTHILQGYMHPELLDGALANLVERRCLLPALDDDRSVTGLHSELDWLNSPLSPSHRTCTPITVAVRCPKFSNDTPSLPNCSMHVGGTCSGLPGPYVRW